MKWNNYASKNRVLSKTLSMGLYLEADIVSEDGGAVSSSPALVVVSLAGVDLAQQEPGLAPSLLSVDVTGNGKSEKRINDLKE